MSNRHRFAAPAFGLTMLGLVAATGLTLSQPALQGFEKGAIELPETGEPELLGRGHVRGARPAQADRRRAVEASGDADAFSSMHPRKLGRGEGAMLSAVDLAGLGVESASSTRGARPALN